MKALITGASSGIGREIARVLAEKGVELVLCSRNENALHELAAELKTPCRVVALDLSEPENCRKLHETTRADGIDILVNNAGFGVFGAFSETSLDSELECVRLNVCAVHILTKLFLADFRERGREAFILNVSSMAGFFPGPLFSTYYATKNYVSALTAGIAEELRRERSRVSVSLLCPGPVPTNFGARAGVSFGLSGTPVREVAELAVRGMFAGKLFIVPGRIFRALLFLSRFLPRALTARIVFRCQNSKSLLARR